MDVQTSEKEACLVRGVLPAIPAFCQAMESGNDHFPPEPVRVLTVRVPDSVHQQLKLHAQEANTSMNRLCLCKLTAEVRYKRIAHHPQDRLVPEFPPEHSSSAAQRSPRGEDPLLWD